MAARHVMLYFCTYFDSNYLSRALVLYRSLVDVGAEFTLWALCLDDEAYRLVSELALPGFEPVRARRPRAGRPRGRGDQGHPGHASSTTSR